MNNWGGTHARVLIASLATHLHPRRTPPSPMQASTHTHFRLIWLVTRLFVFCLCVLQEMRQPKGKRKIKVKKKKATRCSCISNLTGVGTSSVSALIEWSHWINWRAALSHLSPFPKARHIFIFRPLLDSFIGALNSEHFYCPFFYWAASFVVKWSA